MTLPHTFLYICLGLGREREADKQLPYQLEVYGLPQALTPLAFISLQGDGHRYERSLMLKKAMLLQSPTPHFMMCSGTESWIARMIDS